MASNNVAEAAFTNVASTPSVDRTMIWVILLILAATVALAYGVYIFFIKNSTWEYPFHRSIWEGSWGTGTTYTPQLITPAQDALSKVVTSDHTKLTGETAILTGSPVTIQPPHIQPVPAQAESTSEKRPDVVESWCFVGEDLSGRYCVKVPNDSACSKDRVYNSRTDCQMAAANHLPAGVVNSHAVGIQPLSTMNIV